ncbi:5'-methylthioadenosine/S-adenosylhomocysteine nucleosidase [Bacillus sp. BRMEA1]|nr:5'-methylthioadenosine/S-adenosylhomocysteine nucleosidase [Neobacillus endophyticus]
MFASIFSVMITIVLFPAGGIAAEKDFTNSQRPIAVQGALDIEISSLLKTMGTYKQETYGGYTFFIGKISKIPVIVARTEMGKANAAASTALLIDHYHPKAIINQGTAGGHDPNLHVFDTVIGEKVMNIDSMESEHLDAGQGIRPKTWKFTKTFIRENGKIQEYAYFKSDPQLVKSAIRAAKKYQHGKVVLGKIGSTDFWNREVDRIQWFHQTAGTSAEEMEAAAVAQVAKGFHIPFLSIRTISNSEVSGDKIIDQPTAGQYSAEFAVEIIKELGK